MAKRRMTDEDREDLRIARERLASFDPVPLDVALEEMGYDELARRYRQARATKSRSNPRTGPNKGR